MKTLTDFFDEEEKRTLRLLSPNGSFIINQITRLVNEFLEQFREPSIDQSQIDWNAGLDCIISRVETVNHGDKL